MPDDVVEHRLGSQQQSPVEAHRARRRAARPSGALAADRQARVRAPARAHARSSRGATSARAARRYQRSMAASRSGAGRHEQLDRRGGRRASGRAARRAGAPRRGTGPCHPVPPPSRGRGRARRRGARSTARARGSRRPPRLGGTPRQHHLDAAGGVDGHAHAARAVRAPDAEVTPSTESTGYGRVRRACDPGPHDPLTDGVVALRVGGRARHPRDPDRIPGRPEMHLRLGRSSAAERRRARPRRGAARRSTGAAAAR